MALLGCRCQEKAPRFSIQPSYLTNVHMLLNAVHSLAMTSLGAIHSFPRLLEASLSSVNGNGKGNGKGNCFPTLAATKRKVRPEFDRQTNLCLMTSS